VTPPAATPPPSTTRYVVGVVVTVLAVLSQYFVPETIPSTLILYGNLPGDLFVVYGIPVISFALLIGAGPLRRWRARMGTATWEGLRWYGGLSLLGLVITFVLLIVYSLVDPSALGLLKNQNPAITQAQSDPWLYVGLSFVVGAFEETIFRGWIFGYWMGRGGSWVGPAAWTSAVFAGVHLYYGTTYGAASPLIFPTLFLLGFAFAATYRFSGGNLVLPALLHGENDASAYLQLINGTAGLVLHYAVVLFGGLIALIAYLRSDTSPPASPTPAATAPYAPEPVPFSSPTPPGRE